MNENFISRQQLMTLPERIRKAGETNAAKELYSYLWEAWRNKDIKPINVLVVGTGGSYPAALVAAHSIREEMYTPNVEVATPQTALRIINQFDRIINCDWHPKYDLVIGISYSGKTPDIKAVSEACRRRSYPFVLLTGANKSEMKEIYHEDDLTRIVSYFNADDNSGRERGMISMASTLIPATLFDDCVNKHWSEEIYQEYLESGEKFVSELNISEIASSIKKHPVVHIFYEWETLPTAADIESKFIESGIANVVLHEKKNFSHGRNVVLSTQKFGLVINLTKYSVGILMKTFEVEKHYKNDYDKNLADFLKGICAKKSAHYLELGNGKIHPAEWNLEEMSKLPYFITTIGEKLNVDISRPLTPFPKEANDLYEYKGEF